MSVYFAQIGRDGPIKIGDSDDITRRLRALQNAMPWKLHLLLVLENAYANQLYVHFSAARMKGEWFYPTADLLAFIREPKLKGLRFRSPKNWEIARAERGTNLVFLRPISDFVKPDGRRSKRNAA